MSWDFVDLELRRNRGWPWPEESYGLTPMYGEDGWCRSCGVPKRTESGSLILQRRAFGPVEGAWVPNWLFDVICLERSVAERAKEAGFALPLLPVEWHGLPPGDAVQIVPPIVGERWFDVDDLRVRATAKTVRPARSATSAASGAGTRCSPKRCRRIVTRRSTTTSMWQPVRNGSVMGWRRSDKSLSVGRSRSWLYRPARTISESAKSHARHLARSPGERTRLGQCSRMSPDPI